jgi:hypothetical protein
MNVVRKISPYLLLVVLITPAILPLFKPTVSGTADGLGHRFRLVSFYNSLKEGNWHPRWASEAALGYGAPTFLFNYPLPYYLASFFHSLGFTIDRSGQMLSATCLFLSGIFMFLAVGKLLERWGRLGEWGGLAASVVYTYAPYHLQMTYLYDSWGEEVAFVFPSLILYLTICLIGQISQIERIIYMAVLTISWVLFILSHNVSALMFSPVLLFLSFVILVSEERAHPGSQWDSGHLPADATHQALQAGARMTLLLIINSFILAVVISSFFWLPAYVLQSEMKYPQFLGGEGAMRGSFFKSFSFQWETAFEVIKEGVTHYLDFTIGLPIIFVGVISFFCILLLLEFATECISITLRKIILRCKMIYGGYIFATFFGRPKDKSPKGNLLVFIGLLVLLFLSLYLTTYHSNWLWNWPIISKYFSYILYPFRFLFVASFAGTLLTGLLVGNIRERWAIWVIGGIMTCYRSCRLRIPNTSSNSRLYAALKHGEAGVWDPSLASPVTIIVVIILSIFQGLPYTKPYVDIFPFPNSYFFQRQTVSGAPGTHKNMLIQEFLPKEASLSFLEKEEGKSPSELIEIVEEKGKIENIKSSSEELEASLDFSSPGMVRINRFSFPNWEMRLNGMLVTTEKDQEGRMFLTVPAGKYQLRAVFAISNIEKISILLSITGIILLVGEMIYIGKIVKA